MATVSYSEDDLRTHAQGNGTAFSLALVRYARDQGQAADAVAQWLGALFAPSWDPLRGQGALEIARAAGLQVASLGGTVHELDGDNQRAEVSVTDAVDEEFLQAFGLVREESDALFTVFTPIAASLGYDLRCQRTGEVVTLVFEQSGSR